MPPEMFRHYALGVEATRVEGPGNLERVRSESILRRYLPAAPVEIYDVGGGPGAYAFRLAAQGYTVHLLDVVPEHIEQARTRAAEGGPAPASMEVGDARALPRADRSADVALLMGPLYHLVEREDRIASLREAHRVLRPDGMIFAAVISKFASMLDGLARSFFTDPEFSAIVDRDLLDGQHRNPSEHPEYFTTTFFHHPHDLGEELTDAGFQQVEALAVEGPAWLMPQLQQTEPGPARERMLELLARTEGEPSMLGVSAHLIGIGRKTES